MAEKKIRRRGKRVRKGRKHESIKIHKLFKLEGEKLVRLRKPCPRCGPGVYLAEHKGRLYCGRCGYTEFEKSK
ncbi:MAG: 30S ribosomal protein S27ae [Candidatus Aenigmatarchaeota archaeon]|nr:MAG: 30S ribosomal protein S27ae [Candidatus Aenigmarchaeota archaeon]